MEENEILKAADRVSELIASQKLSKIVFSVPDDKSEIRTEGRLVRIKNRMYLQTENIPLTARHVTQTYLPTNHAEKFCN